MKITEILIYVKLILTDKSYVLLYDNRRQAILETYIVNWEKQRQIALKIKEILSNREEEILVRIDENPQISLRRTVE